MKKLLFIFCLFSITICIGQTDNQSDIEKQDTYQQQINAQFKKESLWYRIWNRYEINPGFSKYALGYSFIQPVKGWSNYESTIALRYRRNHLDIGASFWEGTPTNQNDTTIEKGSRWAVGYTTPSGLFSIGKRILDVKGFLIQPAFSGGYINDNGSHGIYFAPSIHFQLPFVIIEARANIDYTGNGLNIYPELSLQLDALRTLFDPTLTRVGTNNYSHTSATPMGGGWYSVSSYSSSEPFHIKDVGPFWTITPRYGLLAIGEDLLEPYHSYGLGISGRINYLCGDIYFKKSKMATGVQENNNVDGYTRENFDNSKVKGLVNTNEITFEAGLNIVGLFFALAKPASTRNMGAMTTPLNRLNFHIGLSYIMPKDAIYENADSAQAYTDNFFAQNPTIDNNTTNNPLKYTNEWGVTYGVSVELGAVGVKGTSTFSKSNGGSTMIEIYYMLPITKIWKVYRK